MKAIVKLIGFASLVLAYSHPMEAQCNFPTLSSPNICAGQSTSIVAPAGFRSYNWSSGETVNSITVTPATTSNYDCTVTCYGTELITNGGFESGNTGFFSGHNYTTPNGGLPEGDYTIAADSKQACTCFNTTAPHTGNNTMIVNGANAVQTVVWQQTITITPNTDYEFSTWMITNSNPAPYANLQFSINGQLLGNIFVGVPYNQGWKRFFETWKSPAVGTTAVISILNMIVAAKGNDFALDDISFRPYYSQTQSSTVTVNPVPTADILFPAVACENTALQLTDATTGATINNWQWDINNDGSVEYSTQNPSHTFTSAGNSDIKLSVVSAAGCSSNVVKSITINALPAVAFTGDVVQGCGPLCVNFTHTTANAASVAWSASDGFSSTNATANNCFAPGNMYNVTLAITDNNGCSNSLTKSNYIDVFPLPVADFSYTPQPVTILDPIIQITDKSAGSTIWKYTFGDGNNSSEQNPEHVYDPADTTTYIVTQIVENSYGCKDSIKKAINIKQGFAIYIPNAITPNNDGTNDIFLPEAIGVEEFEMYIFNRWGEIVFKSTDIKTGWSPSNTPIDTYVYFIKAKSVFSKSYSYRGSVALVN
ncbi:MAG: gliding motility-associated C-terminal domain-containing protein [Bacteroidetes bacterium]|nr:gliding motility-associated C-terminal domain-containing protein [Bacteroidota bacterium]